MPDKTFVRTEPFTLPIELLNRLTDIAETTGESKDNLMLLALERYLEDLEYLADAEAILERIHSGQEEVMPLDEVVKELGLEI